jgi:hypothetical protein
VNAKKFYPVIHCIPLAKGGNGHALLNSKIAKAGGADGIFLVGDAARYDICYIYEHVRKQHPELWIGLKFPDVSINQQPVSLLGLVKTCINLNGLWADTMPLNPAWKNETGMEIFGDMAFEDNTSLATACQSAIDRCNVATIPSDEFGDPPSLATLAMAKSHLGEHIPLAVADGIDAQNVAKMKPFVDIFLVASNITRHDPIRGKQKYLIPEKISRLADLIHV